MEKKDTFFIIPARRDSKGLPFKNRKLLDYTINNIPIELHEKTIVTTNDEKIIEKLSATNINILRRDEQLCLDDISIKDVMLDVVKKFQMKSNDTIVMLYLTSPDRKFSNIKKILEVEFIRNDIKDLTKITNMFLPRIINKQLNKIFEKGNLEGKFSLQFDKNGNIEKKYKFSGKILNASINLTKEYSFQNLTTELN